MMVLLYDRIRALYERIQNHSQRIIQFIRRQRKRRCTHHSFSRYRRKPHIMRTQRFLPACIVIHTGQCVEVCREPKIRHWIFRFITLGLFQWYCMRAIFSRRFFTAVFFIIAFRVIDKLHYLLLGHGNLGQIKRLFNHTQWTRFRQQESRNMHRCNMLRALTMFNERDCPLNLILLLLLLITHFEFTLAIAILGVCFRVFILVITIRQLRFIIKLERVKQRHKFIATLALLDINQ
mmetsp:Transcript_16792/g.26051  ORF Transcript_16792/g.26051 Transcript_16792/m.26051 type:complete len:235 (-) Transcript_16792:551-1255(-)